MYDANHQCRLAFGANARHCDGIELECQTLWCRVDNRCVTRLEAAAEGTQCGKHKWCYHGECVTMGERPAAIHGNWGEWSPWSPCSRSCGAGVEAATRHCDNPPPSNGGKYCTGDRRRYHSDIGITSVFMNLKNVTFVTSQKYEIEIVYVKCQILFKQISHWNLSFAIDLQENKIYQLKIFL
ncbi:A disintegrin and metalloproteinase with thrombospondin motifs 12 [Armadillidium vulgare]|nr:A disintegrin and metalloproteinase with thrombospondin motifs 12 [Armadillidium vulgare]